MELLLALIEPMKIGRVDHPDQCIGLIIVILPVISNGLLTAHIPEVQLVASEFKGFDVEPQSWADRIDIFITYPLEYGCLSSVVKSTVVSKKKASVQVTNTKKQQRTA